MKKYAFPIVVIAALYALNHFLLIPLTGCRLLAWHGADFLAGALILCILNALLTAANRPPLVRFLPGTVFLLGCGLFWEYVTPLYLSPGTFWRCGWAER